MPAVAVLLRTLPPLRDRRRLARPAGTRKLNPFVRFFRRCRLECVETNKAVEAATRGTWHAEAGGLDALCARAH